MSDPVDVFLTTWRDNQCGDMVCKCSGKMQRDASNHYHTILVELATAKCCTCLKGEQAEAFIVEVKANEHVPSGPCTDEERWFSEHGDIDDDD